MQPIHAWEISQALYIRGKSSDWSSMDSFLESKYTIYMIKIIDLMKNSMHLRSFSYNGTFYMNFRIKYAPKNIKDQ